jgi:hypothetical protein
MSDNAVRDRIQKLVEEERRLLGGATDMGPDAARDQRLQELQFELDTSGTSCASAKRMRSSGLTPTRHRPATRRGGGL